MNAYRMQITLFLSEMNLSDHVLRQTPEHCFYPSSLETGKEIHFPLIIFFMSSATAALPQLLAKTAVILSDPA